MRELKYNFNNKLLSTPCPYIGRLQVGRAMTGSASCYYCKFNRLTLENKQLVLCEADESNKIRNINYKLLLIEKKVYIDED